MLRADSVRDHLWTRRGARRRGATEHRWGHPGGNGGRADRLAGLLHRGRAGGRPLVYRFGRYLLITRSDIDRAERFVAGRGRWSIPLGRVLPVVRTFVSLVAGIIEVPPLLFGVLSLIGTAVWVTAISLIGYGVGSVWHSIAHGIAVAGYAIAVMVILAVAGFIAHRMREARLESWRAQR